jgi:hypothetical protein
MIFVLASGERGEGHDPIAVRKTLKAIIEFAEKEYPYPNRVWKEGYEESDAWRSEADKLWEAYEAPGNTVDELWIYRFRGPFE